MRNNKTYQPKLLKAFAFVVATAYLTGAGDALAANMKVTVRKVVGDVQAAQGAKWVKATVGMQLISGAKIKTGSGGEALLTWDNGNVVKLRPLSNLVLAQVAKTGGTTNVALDIKKGGIFAKVKKLQTAKSSFNVGTPTAVAGVRGTAGDMSEEGVSLTDGSMVAAPRPPDMDMGDPAAINNNLDENGISFEAGQELPFTESGVGEPQPIPEDKLEELQAEQKETETVAAEVKDDTAPAGDNGGKEEGKEESKEEGGKEEGGKEEGGTESSEGTGEEAPSSGAEAGDGSVEVGGGEIGPAEIEVDTSVVDTVDSVVNDVIEGTEDAEELFDEFTGALEIIIE